MSRVQLKNPGRPSDSVLSYKDCLMSGGTSKAVAGFQRAARESPQAMESTLSESEVSNSPSGNLSNSPSLTEVQLEEVERRVKEVDKQLLELSENHTSLVEQAQAAFAELRKIQEQKEKAVIDTYKAVYDSKYKLLMEYRSELASMQETQVSPSTGETPPLPTPPILCGETLCGFVPEMTNLTQSTASLIMEHREEVELGSEMRASVIGSINNEGVFWVRILPQDSAVQDIMLLNLSNTISVELSLSQPSFLRPGNVKVGDLCCALYAEDQRWYRGRIVSLMERNQAKVFFVDYGNMETISLTNLYPLHPKFLVYPFQMIQCCFSNNSELSYEREVRWKFTDLTHGSELTVKIAELLPRNVNGRLHRVQLVNQSKKGGQPFEVGNIIVAMATPSSKPQGSNSIIYRDVRYAGKVTSSEFQAETVVELEDGYFTQSSEGPLNTSSSGDALPSSALNSSEEEKATPQSNVAIKVTMPTPSSPQVVDRASSSSPLLPDKESKILAPQERESRSLPPPDRREPRGKVNGFSRGSSPVAMAGRNEVVLEKDKKYSVFATTPLLRDGTLWLQLATTEEPEFVEMVEKLQVRCNDEPPTPVFFSPGDFCAALFSEDECWYRARVEDVVKNKFRVRYVDFGNCELREKDSLMALGSEFREIPFQAVCCSIAREDHASFTNKEIEKFNIMTDSQKLIAKILGKVENTSVENTSAETDSVKHELNKPLNVDLSMKLGDNKIVSIMEAVCRVEDEEAPDSLSLSGVTKFTTSSNWADTMDELQSPKNDGISPLPARRAEVKATPPLHSPPLALYAISLPLTQSHVAVTLRHLRKPLSPPRPPQSVISSLPPRNSSSPLPPRNVVPPPPPSIVTSSSSPTSPMPTYSSRLRSTASPVQAKRVDKAKERGVAKSCSPQNGVSGGSVARSSSSVPRIQTNALDMVRKNLQAAENDKAKQKRATPEQDSLSAGLAQPKGMWSINQAIRNGGVSFPPSGRRRKSPDPDSTQIMDKEGGMRAVKGLDGNHLAGSPKPLSVQPYKGTTVPSPEQAELDSLPQQTCTRLFVKNIPLDRTVEDMRVMFSQYGKVLGLVPIPSRKNVIYMYMEPRAAQVAIDNLHGKAISKYSKPMIVELSNPPRSSRS